MIVVYDTVGNAALEKIDFDILALGEDHKGKDLTRLKNSVMNMENRL